MKKTPANGGGLARAEARDNVEVLTGFEPVHNGFADRCVNHFAIQPNQCCQTTACLANLTASHQTLLMVGIIFKTNSLVHNWALSSQQLQIL